VIKLKTMWWIFAATMFLAVGVANAGPPPRLGPPQCTRQVVKSGDTAIGIARKAGVPWQTFAALNTYIPDLNQIWPLDELTLWCPPPEAPKPVVVDAPPPTTAAPSPPPVAELQEAAMAPTAVDSGDGGFECNPTGRQRWDGSEQCVTPLHVIAGYLRTAGFDGESLVIMLAVTLGESAGDPYSHGDRQIADGKWGDSVGWMQIRTLRAQKGTGGPRDEDALLDPVNQAAAAWRISNGGTNWQPWGAFTNGSYRKFLDQARKAAAR
jgi:hypothetical protein